MPQTKLTSVIDHIESQGRITDADVLALRQLVYDDSVVSIIEADRIFALNDQITDRPQNWSEFFVEAVTDFLVRQTPPYGYVDESNAMWLTERISHDGVVDGDTEMALMMNVLKYAERVPTRLELFALDQVKMAVVDGLGALARDPSHQDNVIDAREVELVRLALYACGGDGGFGISRQEAEVLFDLNDATNGAPNHESWKDLFVGCIANYLMVLPAPEMPDHQEALRRHNWLASDEGISWNILGSMKTWMEDWRDSDAPSWGMDSAGRKVAEAITSVEASWLIERLNRDGVIHENEQALLDFLQAECPDIHASLTPLLSAAA
jgi:hypothetical protein